MMEADGIRVSVEARLQGLRREQAQLERVVVILAGGTPGASPATANGQRRNPARGAKPAGKSAPRVKLTVDMVAGVFASTKEPLTLRQIRQSLGVDPSQVSDFMLRERLSRVIDAGSAKKIRQGRMALYGPA